MISIALQSGNRVCVYNERNHTMFEMDGELVRYTITTVTIRKDDGNYVYNDKGQVITIL